MSRLSDMARRLHPLLREGEAIAAILTPPAVALEIVTEEALDVQRAHRFDDVLTLEEAAALAALLDIPPEPWQNLALFRAWVHANRDAVLAGSVTVDAITTFARRYAAEHSAAKEVRFGPDEAQLVENPQRRAVARPDGLDMPALSRLSLEVASVADASAGILLTGVAGGPEACPLIANLTTGTGLLWRGRVMPGQRLAIRAGAEGVATATLEGVDVSDRLVGLTGLVPGTSWAPGQVTRPAPALALRRGGNILWFLPVAHYDTEGLDRFLLSLADLDMRQGKWDESRFNHALFDQPPAVRLVATWVEREPAAIALDMSAASVVRAAAATGTAEEDLDRLAAAFERGLQRLKAAGVRAQIRRTPFVETQGAFDRLAAMLPMHLKEAGSTGAERLPDLAGRWGVTPYDGSTFG